MKKLLAVALACLIVSPAWAGSGTVNYTSAGSAPFQTTVNASSNNLSQVTLWDSAAGANGLNINSSGQAAIQAPPTLPLPTGAATSALQTTGNSELTTINTTLGSPFQAGGSIGNTSFGATESGTWSNRILGNGGASLDAAIGGTTGSPTNVLVAGCQYNSSAPTFTTGNSGGLQCTVAGSLHTTVDNTLGSQNLIQTALSGTTSASPVLAAVAASSAGTVATLVGCTSHFYTHVTTATDTLLVQGVSSQTIKICGAVYHYAGSAAQSVYLENTASTNANCSSTKTQIYGLDTGSSSAPSTGGFYNPLWGGLANTSGNGVCINSSGSGPVDVDLWYTQGS